MLQDISLLQPQHFAHFFELTTSERTKTSYIHVLKRQHTPQREGFSQLNFTLFDDGGNSILCGREKMFVLKRRF
jgi:hypothetical protein